MAIHGVVETHMELGDATLLVTRYDAEAVLKSHLHCEQYVSVVMQGSYTEVCRREARLCRPGTVLVHDSKETHADYFLEPARVLNVEVTTQRNSESLATLIDVITVRKLCPPSIGLALRAASSSLNRKRCESKPPVWLRGALDDCGWVNGRDIRSVADRLGIHPTHFARSFRAYTGLTPSRYRARRRVRLASELLLFTSQRVSSIALECGFSDQSHLTRVFRAVVGLPPGAFRAVFSR